jgi:putative Ca2+/H+ antiporter (TMEM165/GDT1 family)
VYDCSVSAALVWASYGTVLVAELAGDKSLYTLGSLATRFAFAPILAGAALAFAVKMLAAVLLGRLVAQLPPLAISVLGASTFFAMALVMWREPATDDRDTSPRRWSHAMLVSFVAIGVPEWGDPGQLAAAVLVADGGDPFVVWLGAMLAMITKGALAITLGIGLRRFVPRDLIRRGTVVLCLAMGVLAALRVEL